MDNQHSFDPSEIDKINQACYDNRASMWDRFPYPDTLPPFLSKHHPKHLGNRVLDIGSGTGVVAKWLADQGWDVLCLDPSPEMVRRCKEKGLKALPYSIQSYQAQEQFAMVFAILSLIHVPKNDCENQIKKIASLLPKGGLLFLGMLQGKGEGFSEGPDFPRFFAYYSPEEILKLTQGEFIQKEYRNFPVNGSGYMLFVLEKK